MRESLVPATTDIQTDIPLSMHVTHKLFVCRCVLVLTASITREYSIYVPLADLDNSAD